MNFIIFFEYIGMFMFAFSGGVVAREEKFDFLGITILAVVTALGGGILRDVIINTQTPYALSSWTPYAVIFLGILTALKFKNLQDNFWVVVLDAIGLSAFTVSSGLNAINSGYNLITVIFCCFLSAVGGGIIRDVLVNRKPYVFQKDIYAITSVEGAVFMYFTHRFLGETTLIAIGFSLVFITRIICYMNKISLPVFNDVKDIRS